MWYRYVAGHGSFAKQNNRTFRRMVVATKNINWSRLSHFGDVISLYPTSETLIEFNFNEFTFTFEMHISYAYSTIDSKVKFGR